MPPTLKEVRASLAERVARERWAAGGPGQQAALAAVSAEKLLGDPNWDRYIMRLQALLNESAAARGAWASRCTEAISVDEVRIAQLNFHACEARLKTLIEVMAIPRSIVDEAHHASSGPESP